jgi:hypothetical protein
LAAYIALSTLTDIREQTKNAKISAIAALKSSEAVMNAERAWVMVSLEWQNTRGLINTSSGSRGENTNFAVRLVCTNQGKTPAWITEKRIRAVSVDPLPPEPDIDGTQLIQKLETLSAGQESIREEDVTAEGLMAAGKTTAIYGIVRYRDIFRNDHYTTFGYCVFQGNVPLGRIVALPKYNENT